MGGARSWIKVVKQNSYLRRGGDSEAASEPQKWSMASYRGAMLLATVLLLSSTLVVLQSFSSLEGLLLAAGLAPKESSRAGQLRRSREPAMDAGQAVQWLIRQAEKNGTDTCDEESTSRVALVGRPELQDGMPLLVKAGVPHELLIVSYTGNGRRRCAGGDFYETETAVTGC